MKKNKPGKYLRFYIECMDRGELPSLGLCNSLSWTKKLECFEPTRADDIKLGYANLSTIWWGYDKQAREGYKQMRKVYREFTSLRATIVLFLAAMNNEL